MQKKHKQRSLGEITFRRNMTGFLFISPWLLGLLLFFITPIIDTVAYSFSTVAINDAGTGVSVVPIGLGNYIYAFTADAKFPQLLVSSLYGMADIPLILIFSLFAATLINEKFIGRSLVRLIFFLPVIYGTGIIIKYLRHDTFYSVFQNRYDAMSSDSTIMQMIFSFDFQHAARKIAIKLPAIEYIFDAVNRLFTIINRSGVQIVIFLAGLNTIPTEYYEAAKIDGATGWDTFWQITLPNIVNYLVMNAVFSLIDSFVRVEDTLASQNLLQYITHTTFSQGRFGVGAAMSLVSFVSIGGIIVIAALIIRLLIRDSSKNRRRDIL